MTNRVTNATKLPALILLVRHGATEWSVAGRHTGRTDLPLTDAGEQQAIALTPLLTRMLAGFEPMVFTSPLERAARTAELALPGYEAERVPAIQEYDYGDYEGLTSTEILTRDPSWNLFEGGCPGGESGPQVATRCDEFRDEILRVAPGRAVVAFTHGHLSRILTARLLHLPANTAGSLWNDTATVGVIDEHRGRLVMVGWNLRAS
ncbi:MAG: histidine phosphatase family protein [Ilumatobacteraceae bacterium]